MTAQPESPPDRGSAGASPVCHPDRRGKATKWRDLWIALLGKRLPDRPHRFLGSALGLARNDSFFVPLQIVPTERAERHFMLSSRPRERSNVSSCHPDRGSGASFQAVIPTEGAERSSGGIYVIREVSPEPIEGPSQDRPRGACNIVIAAALQSSRVGGGLDLFSHDPLYDE